MSTRGAWGFHKKGRDKVTFNHWDSYPKGLGKTIVDFIRTVPMKEMERIFDEIILVNGENYPTEDKKKEYLNWAVANEGDLIKITSNRRVEYLWKMGTYEPHLKARKEHSTWDELLRIHQGHPEFYVLGLKYMTDDKEFIKESLLCEWVYIINLDDCVLEVYSGWKSEPQKNRYYTQKHEFGYFNCGILERRPLSDLLELSQNEITEWLQILDKTGSICT